MTARSALFNPRPLREGALLPPPGPEDLPSSGFRIAELERVREGSTDYVRRVLDAVELEGRRRWVSVEVRVSRILPGRTIGAPGWHMDTVPDPWDPSPSEVHHLFVSGTASLTEFLAAPTQLDVPDDLHPRARMAALDAQVRRRDPPVPTLRVPSCRVVSYGRMDLHRASPGTHEELRLLVRVTESDVLRPHGREVPWS